jgi:hypothetical protein
MSEARINAALTRIKKRLEKDFPIGSRVRLKAEARKMWPRYANSTGIVIRYYKGVSLMVQFDGRKTASGWHPDFFKRVRP